MKRYRALASVSQSLKADQNYSSSLAICVIVMIAVGPIPSNEAPIFILLKTKPIEQLPRLTNSKKSGTNSPYFPENIWT
jgi:hypothetical protein